MSKHAALLDATHGGLFTWPPYVKAKSYSTFLASADDTPPPAAQRTASLAARFLMRLGQRSEDLARWAADPDTPSTVSVPKKAKASPEIETSLLKLEGSKSKEHPFPDDPAMAMQRPKKDGQDPADPAKMTHKEKDEDYNPADPAKMMTHQEKDEDYNPADPAKMMTHQEKDEDYDPADPAKMMTHTEKDAEEEDPAKMIANGEAKETGDAENPAAQLMEEKDTESRLDKAEGEEHASKEAKDDPLENVVVDPDSGNILDGKTGQAIDPLSGEVVEDGSYIDDDTGLAVDPYKGKIYDPVTGQGNDD